MILVVGLGNPGKQYEKTRHNVGFLVLDAFRKKHKFSDWKFIKKYNSLVSEGEIDWQKILLVKPQTYMNRSGEAVKKLTSNLQLITNNLWVVHDDIYLPLGSIKISVGRGSAGHKGIESVINALKTKNFVRFRIGTSSNQAGTKNIKNIVLKPFSKHEKRIIKYIISTATQAITEAILHGTQKAMNIYNKKSKMPRT